MQQWFGLSDSGTEEALRDVPALRSFARLHAGDDLIPDESSTLRFRHRLEQHGLADQLLAEVNALLGARGLLLRQGTIIDATQINAPGSMKNQDKARDPEMHQAEKSNQSLFGMKTDIGVDAEPGPMRTVVTMAASVNGVTQPHARLHGDETDVLGDASYQDRQKRDENAARAVTKRMAIKPGKRRALADTQLGRLLEKIEHAKASSRAPRSRTRFASSNGGLSFRRVSVAV